MNQLFFYEMSVTVNNKLEKAFNKDMKVAGWYKGICFLAGWPNHRGVATSNKLNVELVTNPQRPNQKLSWFKQPEVVNQTVEGGMGRLFTPSWKSLLITVNSHLQTSKKWTIEVRNTLCCTEPKSQEMQSFWLFGFMEQFSDWIHIDWMHTMVTKPHKAHSPSLYWWEGNRTVKLCLLELHTCSWGQILHQHIHHYLNRTDSDGFHHWRSWLCSAFNY